MHGKHRGAHKKVFLRNEFIEQNPNLTYEELVTQFGSPKDIAVGYYDTIDDDYLLKN